ncbi:MAG: NUDIX domain-containing protein [bacterium]
MDNIQYISVLIFNDTGELALQLRAAHDTRDPLHWDFSVGGHLEPGEDPLLAAKREQREELGIESPLTYVGIRVYNDRPHHIYVSRYSGAFQVDSEEVADLQFFSFEKIQQMIDAGTKITPPFVSFWESGLMHQASYL